MHSRRTRIPIGKPAFAARANNADPPDAAIFGAAAAAQGFERICHAGHKPVNLVLFRP
jgi:hypothetical protein